MDEKVNNTINLPQMLELQLSEIEMLKSMFPGDGEFKLDDHLAPIAVRQFIEEKIKYDYLNARIGFTVKVTPEGQPKEEVEIVCRFPHEYPSVKPQVFTRAPLMCQNTHRKFNELLQDFINSLELGDICTFSVIQWIQENISNYMHEKTENSSRAPVRVEDNVFTRLWIYSHHIYSKFKRRDILEWADELKITGFSLPGKPGVICAEGYSRNVDEYWYRIRRMNWKKLMVKEKEDHDVTDNNCDTYRKFNNFEEKVFDVRPGKGREYHMDLGKFREFLVEHNCGNIFSLYFGVD